jgi:hypothetical protein
MVSTFETTDDRELKTATAWALARAGRQDYVSYLAEAAQVAVDAMPHSAGASNANSYAVRDLGSLRNPVATQILEKALESKNNAAVEYAVVNLLFNQPGKSEKARQAVLRQLRGGEQKLPLDLLLQVASKWDDPEIRAGGEEFDRRSGDGLWKYWGIERRKWSIYNWIDDYVTSYEGSTR